MSHEADGLTEKTVSIWMRINERLTEETSRRENELVAVLYGSETGTR